MAKGSGSSMASGIIDGPEMHRIAEMTRLLDHCTAAQTIADVQGDMFLSYMLAMTIEAARGAMRRRP